MTGNSEYSPFCIRNRRRTFCQVLVFSLASNSFRCNQIVLSFSSLKAIRAKVWEARSESPLFNCKFYALGMEMLYKKMWERYARGEKPDHVLAIEEAAEREKLLTATS